MTNHHDNPDGKGFICEATGKTTDLVWSDHGKAGSHNSCEHCSEETRSVGQMLHELNEKARRDHKAAKRSRKK